MCHVNSQSAECIVHCVRFDAVVVWLQAYEQGPGQAQARAYHADQAPDSHGRAALPGGTAAGHVSKRHQSASPWWTVELTCAQALPTVRSHFVRGWCRPLVLCHLGINF